MTDLVAAEWLKVRTTRVLYGMVPAAAAISTAAVAGAVLAMDDADLGSTGGIERGLSVTGAGAIVVLVLGILVSAGEHRHGTIGDTYLTTPRRHRVIAAKLILAAALGLGAGALICVASLTTASLLYASQGATFLLGDGEVWRTLVGTLAYSTLFAVLGPGSARSHATRCSRSPARSRGSPSSSTRWSTSCLPSDAGCPPARAKR